MDKTFTVKEVFEAIEKNGYPWAKYDFINYKGESCAIGQGARNLDVDSHTLYHALNNITPEFRVGARITRINDSESETYEDMVKQVKSLLEPYFNQTIEV